MSTLEDVFLCHFPGPLRVQMLGLCTKRWSLEPSVRITKYYPDIMSGSDFQLYRRKRAENSAHHPYYIVADDDCLIAGLEPFMVPAFEVMDRHPEFAILAPWPLESSIRLWTATIPEYVPFIDDEVEEHVSVGGIRVMRKGAMKEWPAIPENHPWYDAIQADYLRSIGYRVGFLKNFQLIHLGHKMSALKH